MSTVMPYLNYREHCKKQGREVKPLTRKQKKALRQHQEATAGREPSGGYKAKTTRIVEPRFNILGEIVGFVPKGE